MGEHKIHPCPSGGRFRLFPRRAGNLVGAVAAFLTGGCLTLRTATTNSNNAQSDKAHPTLIGNGVEEIFMTMGLFVFCK